MLIMADLFKLGMELVKEIPSPELHQKFLGIAGVHARLVFANRVHLGYTQQELANLANVGVTTIHRIEGGHGGVTQAKLQAVLDALEITNEDIAEAFQDMDSFRVVDDSKKKPINRNNKELVEV
jgi:transcriptional regulator with XRE-family HTH domain